MIEAMKQALDALEDIFGKNKVDVGAINALRQAIAEAEKQDGDCQRCGGKGCVACDAREQEPFEDLASELFAVAQISPTDDGFSETIERIESWLRKKFTHPQPKPEDYQALEQALTRLQKRYGELEAKIQPRRKWVELPGEADDWDIERCRAYAEQLRDRTRANRAEHAAQAIEWLLAQLASHQIIGKNQEPKREPLTDDEIWKNDDIMAANSGYGANFETLREVIRATEAAHGIKGEA